MNDSSSTVAGPDRTTLFDAVGGSAYFDSLVERFYAVVAPDPVLRPLYPEEDLAGAKWRLSAFLQQFWGGPTTYNDERGHPRLRKRHFPFAIGQLERDKWLDAMTGAMAQEPLPDSLSDTAKVTIREMLQEYFESASTAMINQ